MKLKRIVTGARSITLDPRSALSRKDMEGRFVMHHQGKSFSDDREAIKGDWSKATGSADREIRRLKN